MSSVVLDNSASTGAPNSSTLTANGCRLGAGGLGTTGNVVLTQGAGVVVSPNKNQQATIQLNAVGDGVVGNVSVVSWTEQSAALSQVAYNWQLGTGGGGGAIQEGHFALDAYVAGGFSQGLVEIGPCPRGAAGPPVIPPNSAIFGLISPTQSGVATIPIGAATIAVPLTSITAGAVVVFSPLSAPDATCIGIHAVITAGTGFSLTGAANATAAVPLSWFVVHL